MNESVERAGRHTLVREGAASAADAVPLGNGRLGGMLWMPDGAVCLQFGHTGYWRTGEHMDPEFGGYPASIGRLYLRREPAFTAAGARITLTLSPAEAKAVLLADRPDGRSVVELFFDVDRDVLLVRWRETGTPPERAAVELTGWRETVSAETRDGTLILRESPANVRTADEEAYLRDLLGDAFLPEAHAQATAVSVEGIEAEAEADGLTARLSMAAGEPFDAVVRLASAVGPGEDHEGRALALLGEAAGEPYAAGLERHAAWWHDFWSASFLAIDGPDASAETCERYWYMLNYLMASSNRGRRPVKFNYGNWLTATDDVRLWGGGYWYYNERDILLAMLPAGHPELARNLYDLYLDATGVLRRQAEHLFGCEGLFVPETVSPDGAMFLRDRTALYEGPTKFIQLIFSTGLEVALHLHDYARYTGDEEFLRRRAYPFMKGVVAFHRAYMRREEDGAYHIEPANAHETFWRVRDDLPDLAGLRAVLPRLIALSEAWDVDEDERAEWEDFLAHLAPLPKGGPTFEGEPAWEDRGDGIFGLGCYVTDVDETADRYAPCVFLEDNEMHNCHPVSIYGVYPFRITHVGSADRETGVNTFRENVHPFLRKDWAGDVAVPAVLGLADEARALLEEFIAAHGATRLDYMERYGKVATTLDAMLLQGHEGVLWLFPAWPEGWDARFRLRAPGPLEVEAARRGGEVSGVRLRATGDQTVTLTNPWPGEKVRIMEGGAEVATLGGERVGWPARAGKTYDVSPAR